MLFDESDAYLDQGNCKKLKKFIKGCLVDEHKMQVITITHKSEFFESAMSLVGVSINPDLGITQTYSLDLRGSN